MYSPISHLVNEARSMLTRLDQVKPFSLTIPSVPAASVSSLALRRIDDFLYSGKRELSRLIMDFLSWLDENRNNRQAIQKGQHKYSMLKLRFNDILSQVDIFADVLNQRSEQEAGIRTSALDLAAGDALNLPGNYYEVPPVICYVEKGFGAAIRRARTRLPGGKENPVAIVQIPRERMIGSGIASSLFHEVGHQGAALLDLVNSLRIAMGPMKTAASGGINPWIFWDRWISEIIADFWSVSQLGIGSTLGLIGVVSLPRVFVFRISPSDPHPFPWIRVKVSCAIGNALYPHPQWDDLSNLWDSLYPLKGLSRIKQEIIVELLKGIPEIASFLVNHRPKSLLGDALGSVFRLQNRTPWILKESLNEWRAFPDKIFSESPSHVFAVVGQGKADGKIGPEEESSILSNLLSHWALNSTVYISRTGTYRQTKHFNKVNKLLLV